VGPIWNKKKSWLHTHHNPLLFAMATLAHARMMALVCPSTVPSKQTISIVRFCSYHVLHRFCMLAFHIYCNTYHVEACFKNETTTPRFLAQFLQFEGSSRHAVTLNVCVHRQCTRAVKYLLDKKVNPFYLERDYTCLGNLYQAWLLTCMATLSEFNTYQVTSTGMRFLLESREWQ
jgi:hypothetical protein